MNYLELILAFQRWKEVNPLPASAIALWLELTAACNKAGWPEEFTVRSEVLQANAGVSRKQFELARQTLIESDLLHYKKSARANKAGKYRIIISRLFKKDNRMDNSRDYERDDRTDYGRGHSIKDLKDSSSSSSSQYEPFAAAHKRVFGHPINPKQAETLGSYIDHDGMDEAVIVRAIERAGASSVGYNFKFILRIVDDYFRGGAKTLSEAIAIDAVYDQRKQAAASSPGQRPAKKSFAEIGREME
ncbi:hypothetical protein PA598K_01358 [Paenibacillus sp. 598K]|uniref:DnaD domain-containing protein n=1 Tax=Paenibacillus sp. 598K TaxID=1117987 RepID=UPI000FF94B54|nr:DnaD domain protein [Paenibacillus sp. 598K]GBF73073.1 hypothetical protein PA598K_01358 [Paenibacillus sp. 598K]